MQVALVALSERAPRCAGRNSVGQREGPSSETLDRHTGYSIPRVPTIRGRAPMSRERNALIAHWPPALKVYAEAEPLGVRRIGDINFQTNEVLIARRADDPADLCARQPNTENPRPLLALEDGSRN